MPDVLVLSVPIDGSYASVNHTGRDGMRFGRKSPAYKKLFADVLAAACFAMERTGWRTTDDDCEVTLTRYVRDRIKRDAANMGKCEFDALTKAGVWKDDSQAKRVILKLLTDPSGADRVVIVVQRIPSLWRDCSESIPLSPPVRAKASGATPKQKQAGDVAYLDGKPIPRADALRMIGVKD